MPPNQSSRAPFRTLSCREVYDNPWIRVTEHQFLSSRGRRGVYGVVHFKNQAVGVVPYEHGRIWLVGQHRYPLGAYSWEIPAGGSPPGEALEATARRELEEETGLSASRVDRILEMHLSNAVTDEYAAVFLARGLSRGAPSPEDTEQLEVVEVPLAAAYARVRAGEITDSMTVAAVLELSLMRLDGRLTD